jgi:hypothetical protein
MRTVTEKQKLLNALMEALNECDRAALGKAVNLVMDAAWPDGRRRLVKALIEADLPVDDNYKNLVGVCTDELRQEREKRAQTSAKQSASMRARQDVEAEVAAGQKPTSTAPASSVGSRVSEPPRAPSSAQARPSATTGQLFEEAK